MLEFEAGMILSTRAARAAFTQTENRPRSLRLIHLTLKLA
jgi:hypothetical protein